MIIKIWHKYVVEKYESEIDIGDIGFFINKDYTADLSNAENSDKIMESIDRLRNPVKLMNDAEQKITMQYIQNLKKLSVIYNS